ncbi:MAG: UDP-N-acetylmuramate--L-alanine ligase [Anaerolineae bacterium]|nr:UDP-N-acetylmuramate--L-alanine ligase [Anaerolineae bacterium]
MTELQDSYAISEWHNIHIVGIGGAGMSAIARVLHGQGIHVQGSDRRASPWVSALRDEGIPVMVEHAAKNVENADLILASSAVPDDNVELVAARRRGVLVMRRSEFLPILTRDYEVIAVAGAHGKTTVSGMLALTLMDEGLDPTFIVGGVLADLGTNAHAGTSPYFVIEADEYRDTFLSLKPNVAVVTNVEYDHPDYFPSPRFVRLSFGNFVDNIQPGGLLVACNDDPIAHAVAASYHANGGRLVLYGRNPGVGLAWRATDVHPNTIGGVSFVALREDRIPVGEIALRIPGEYNVLNALAVLAVALELDVEFEIARGALERFSGTARRFEVLGEVATGSHVGVTVIDDYAHHPTQIRGVLAAARQRYPGRRIIAAWEPHTFSRIKALHADFMTAFAGADQVVLLPIYAAREVDDGTLTAELLAAQIQHPAVSAASSLEVAVELLASIVQPGDVVMMMGAGDEYVVGKRLLEVLMKI